MMEPTKRDPEITKQEPQPERFLITLAIGEGKLITVREAPDDVLRIAYDEAKKAHAELQDKAHELIERAQAAAQAVAVYLYEMDRRSRSIITVTVSGGRH
jgi:hypothetical protein